MDKKINLFAGMDEKSLEKITKVLSTASKRQNRKSKHIQKRKGKMDFRTNRTGKRK
tara:strand:- start:8 stop:175 length:168 start_codon:yes stop_codon:yes gene_type:complete